MLGTLGQLLVPKKQGHIGWLQLLVEHQDRQRGLMMPTDLDAVSVRKRKTQTQPRTEITVLLVCVVIFLCMLVLLIFDQSFSKAAPRSAVRVLNPNHQVQLEFCIRDIDYLLSFIDRFTPTAP